MSESRFIDFYEILQVSGNADPDTIDRVYRLLAKRYHPDNSATGNPERFRELTDAFKVLSDPEKRAAYDARYDAGKKDQWSTFLQAPMSGVEGDRRTQQLILSLLYKLRRQGPSNPGMGGFELENYLQLTESQLEFSIWYLKAKGLIGVTEAGKYAITVEGVDWISERDPMLRKDRLIEGGRNTEGSEESAAPSGEEERQSILPGSEDSRPEEAKDQSTPE